VHQVRDWYSGVAIKMGRRQGTAKEQWEVISPGTSTVIAALAERPFFDPYISNLQL
jgi:hypothetical protein